MTASEPSSVLCFSAGMPAALKASVTHWAALSLCSCSSGTLWTDWKATASVSHCLICERRDSMASRASEILSECVIKTRVVGSVTQGFSGGASPCTRGRRVLEKGLALGFTECQNKANDEIPVVVRLALTRAFRAVAGAAAGTRVANRYWRIEKPHGQDHCFR